MLCLEFAIPPLPQFVTVGHAVWSPGDRHFARTFGVYDLLLVKRGTLYMTEQDKEYAVGPGKLLVLEAGLPHAGHRPCGRIRKFIGCISFMGVRQRISGGRIFPGRRCSPKGR